MFSFSSSGLLLLSFVSLALGQTYTKCQPLNTTCPPDDALGTSHDFNFNSSTVLAQGFDTTIGEVGYGDNGLEFTISKKGDMPTVVSNFYIFWGSVSVVMRAAKGQGIISTIVLLSDDLDEVDWEMMGGNATTAESNYFGKGNTTTYDRALYHPVNSDISDNFHNYTTHWTSDQLQWWIDGNLVRTLQYGDALGGRNYPQTPMTVRMGIWAGGDSSEDPYTIEWAGGLTNYNDGPFTMYVQSATVTDFSNGKQYAYGDHSGSWQSIQTIAGNSTIKDTLNAPPPLTLAQKWNNLSSGTKIAIYASAGGGGALLFAALLFVCIRQRRKGRQERDAYNAKIEAEREEAYRDQIQLREKGLGGWNKKEYESQGEDALGGWGGEHVAPGTKVDGDGISPVYHSPASPGLRSPVPGRARTMSPGPLVAPQPQRAWNGSPQQGSFASYGGQRSPQSPNFPLASPQGPPQGYGNGYGNGGGYGNARGGYQRF
ncbi:glycoside hydrolase family 16 protein [Oidiodendron maius Zn]|uniref:chitinase n=1 Tax=Oidiodendron maius (strain Zn) TaxID=913774 RepID=A0A0C3H8J7_OIDMZ|nr:glycoside hydrolase family 16 protein [Oidiodendron maius Zn]